MKMKKSIFLRAVFFVFCFFFLVSLIGCDAFVRKFTRKKKAEKLPAEEMVLVPEEYKGPKMTKEELYRQYFLYWKSWQDELIEALSVGANHKKQMGSAVEAIKNLQQLRQMLKEEKQKKLDVYIGRMNELKEAITQDTYGSENGLNCMNAERIKRGLLKDFSYSRVKGSLV